MRFAVLALLLSFAIAAIAAEYRLDPSIHAGDSVPFLAHEGPGAFDSYLAMNLPFAPMAELFRQLRASDPRPLTNRGEAHITVVTPVEYWTAIRPRGILIREVNRIAEELRIQRSGFDVICLGKGSANIEGHTEDTFYVVVESPAFLEIRRRVAALVIARGGTAADFVPEKFHPHITLGFTRRDLHESDGVVKNRDTCVHPL